MEAFIKKICDAAFKKFVMREVWKDGASGARAKFRKAWMTLQHEKAEKGLKRRWKSATKKKQLAFKLAIANLELDISEINSMTFPAIEGSVAGLLGHIKRPHPRQNPLERHENRCGAKEIGTGSPGARNCMMVCGAL
jgi:hypothetical protein